MFTPFSVPETVHRTTALNHDLLLHWLLQNDSGNVPATEILYSFHILNQKFPNLLFYIANDNPNTVHEKTVVEANNHVSSGKLLWDSLQSNTFPNPLHINQNKVP